MPERPSFSDEKTVAREFSRRDLLHLLAAAGFAAIFPPKAIEALAHDLDSLVHMDVEALRPWGDCSGQPDFADGIFLTQSYESLTPNTQRDLNSLLVDGLRLRIENLRAQTGRRVRGYDWRTHAPGSCGTIDPLDRKAAVVFRIYLERGTG